MSAIPESTLQARDFVFDRLADQGYESLNAVQRQFVCVWAACGEVDNGGFWQFFFNTSGDWCLDTPAALEAFDAPELAEIVSSAIAMFPGSNPSRDMKVRRREIDELPEDVDAVWDELSKAFDTTLMDNKIEAFVRKHAAELFDR